MPQPISAAEQAVKRKAPKNGNVRLQGRKQRVVLFDQNGKAHVLHYRQFKDRQGKVRRVLSGKGLTPDKPRS